MDTTPRIHLICNAHLDPIWQWNWEEGLTETLATFEVAAELLDEYPEFVFNHNESVLYEWTRDYRPALFDRIRRHVAAGRWVIGGGWYLQPDCNLPAGESFVRQIVIGRRFFREHFGVEPRTAYNLDPFGHHGNLPQILKLAGYEQYVHFRPTTHELPIDDHLYRWCGIDGSEVFALRPPCGWYNTDYNNPVRGKIERLRKLARELGRDVTVFWGAGDHGGGATRDELDSIRELAAEGDLVQTSLDAYFDAVRDQRARTPRVRGELQKCFPGCYTSVIGTKQRNRRGEGLALAAERYAALAWWLAGADYPAAKLETVWKRVLFNQFHDILPGSSTREGFAGSIELYGHAFTEAREVILAGQLALLRKPQRREPLPLCVFNPRAGRRRTPVEVEFNIHTTPVDANTRFFRVVDAAGAEVPFQSLMPNADIGFSAPGKDMTWRQRILFEPELPALGYAEYRIETTHGPRPTHEPGMRTQSAHGRLTFANDHYTIAFDAATGLVTSLVDAAHGELLARPGGELVVRDDIPDAWGHGMHDYGKVVGRFRAPNEKKLQDVQGGHGRAFCKQPVRIIESGPLATRVEVVQAYGRSLARLRYTLYAGRPEIALELYLEWNERCRAVQMLWPTALDRRRYTTEIPFGAIERKQNNGEEPCGRWVALSSKDAAAAFALVNDGPGGCEVARGVLRQTVVRSPMFCRMSHQIHDDRLDDHIDIGTHWFGFRLRFGAAGAVRAHLAELADDLTMPPTAHVHIPLGPAAAADNGPEPAPHSRRPGAEGFGPGRDAVRIEGEGIELAALKRADDCEDLVVRVHETLGRQARGSLHLPAVEQGFVIELAPFQIRTLRFARPENGATTMTECDLLERA